MTREEIKDILKNGLHEIRNGKSEEAILNIIANKLEPQQKQVVSAEEFLNSIRFDVAHLPELFNDDDKSYYTIPELMTEYSQAVNGA